MKVIDLLNKIAEGKQPKEIKFRETIYKWEKYNGDLGYVDKTSIPYNWFSHELECDLQDNLNEDVEIIEYSNNGLNAFEEPFNNDIRFRLIIDKLNELEGKIDG